jgi:nucleolar protein 58
MLVLFETPAGYALFKLTDENALEDADQLAKAVASPEKASKL